MAQSEVASPQKKAKREGRTIVFVDESGFALVPSIVRTYARTAKTPQLRSFWSKKHMSVIGAITHTGRVFFHAYDKGIKSKQVAKFVRFLLQQIPGKILLIWDRARIHLGDAKRLIEAERVRIKLELLPVCAPEINPEEGVWHLLKDTELKNVCCDTPEELHRQFRLATVRLRHRKKALLACFTHAGCKL